MIRRSPPQKGPVRLHRRRVFILPTRGCLYFGVIVVVMLLVAMNYSNSLSFVLTFLLVGVGLVGMHHAHRNLLALEIEGRAPEDVFAGSAAQFTVILRNRNTQPRYAVHIQTKTGLDAGTIDMPANATSTLSLPVPTTGRGWVAMPRLRIDTEFPMGMFHAWAWVHLDLSGLAYPAPRGHAALPPLQNADQSGEAGAHTGHEDFAGLRPYERGDPPRLIHWKAYARSGELLIKQFQDPRQQSLWLDWQALAALTREARLSQLARWVLDAHDAGLCYGLRLPDEELPPAQGAAHRERCLRSLALFELDDAA